MFQPLMTILPYFRVMVTYFSNAYEFKAWFDWLNWTDKN